MLPPPRALLGHTYAAATLRLPLGLLRLLAIMIDGGGLRSSLPATMTRGDRDVCEGALVTGLDRCALGPGCTSWGGCTTLQALCSEGVCV